MSVADIFYVSVSMLYLIKETSETNHIAHQLNQIFPGHLNVNPSYCMFFTYRLYVVRQTTVWLLILSIMVEIIVAVHSGSDFMLDSKVEVHCAPEAHTETDLDQEESIIIYYLCIWESWSITWAYLIPFKSNALSAVLYRQFGNGAETPD